MVVKHRSSNTQKSPELQLPWDVSAVLGAQQKERRDFCLCNTASTFSHFRFPPTSSMWRTFPPLVKTMLQHLAGVLRRWFPFPDNPGRGKASEQCFWQAAVGRQQAELSTLFSCGRSRISQPIPQGPITGRSLDKAARQTRQTNCPAVPQGFGHAVCSGWVTGGMMEYCPLCSPCASCLLEGRGEWLFHL